METIICSRVFKHTAMLLVVVMTLISVVPNVNAGFVPSKESMAQSMRHQDMAKVQQVLENKMVQQRFKDMGYSQAEIDDRMAQLSDAEVHDLANQLENMAPAGNGLGILVTALVIVILVIIILRLT